MIKILFVLIVIIFGANFAKCQNIKIDSSNVAKNYFAFSLQPSTEGLVTYAIIKINKEGNTTKIFMKRQDWLHQIVGIQESIANPEGKNLLKDGGISGPDVVDEIWKLRYSENPYASQGEALKGWAGKPRVPTEGQLEMLKKFGLNSLSDFIYGDNVVKLLKAMEDSGWVSEYMGK